MPAAPPPIRLQKKKSEESYLLHAFCFSISHHHSLLAAAVVVVVLRCSCSTPCMLLSAVSVCLSHLPTIDFSVLRWSIYMMSTCVPAPFHTTPSVLHLFYLALTLEQGRQLIMRNLPWHNFRWMIYVSESEIEWMSDKQYFIHHVSSWCL